MQIRSAKTWAVLNSNTSKIKINGLSFASVQRGFEISKINFKIFLGVFSFLNFQIQGTFSSNVLLSIYVDILNNFQKNNGIETNKNEKIMNSIYYYVIPLKFAPSCNFGQYLDSQTYN